MGGQYFAGGWYNYRVSRWESADEYYIYNSHGHAYVIIDTARQECTSEIYNPNVRTYFRTVCLRNPKFKITEGNLGDLFISSVRGDLVGVLHNNKIYRYYYHYFYDPDSCWGCVETEVSEYLIKFSWSNPCVKGILIHDGGSIPGKLCVIRTGNRILNLVGFVFSPW